MIKQPHNFLTYHWLLHPVIEFLHFVIYFPCFCCAYIILPFYALAPVKLNKKLWKFLFIFSVFFQTTADVYLGPKIVFCGGWTQIQRQTAKIQLFLDIILSVIDPEIELKSVKSLVFFFIFFGQTTAECFFWTKDNYLW